MDAYRFLLFMGILEPILLPITLTMALVLWRAPRYLIEHRLVGTTYLLYKKGETMKNWTDCLFGIIGGGVGIGCCVTSVLYFLRWLTK